MAKAYDAITVGMVNFDVNLDGFRKEMVQQKVSVLDSITLSVGGDAQNCGISLARMGIKTAICGKIGRDTAGEVCLAAQRDAGLDSRFLAIGDSPTSIAVNLIEGSENPAITALGANTEFCLEDIPAEAFRQCRVMTLNSFFCCGHIGVDFFQKAKAHGILTVADTNGLQEGDSMEDIADCFPYVDYFMPSFTEAADMTGERAPEAIVAVLRDHGCKNVVIKLGDRGCYYATPETANLVPGFAVTVVDTTGCGDNFVAGFVAGLLQGLPVERCARLANAAGAITAGYLGSNGAVRSFAQLEEFSRR